MFVRVFQGSKNMGDQGANNCGHWSRKRQFWCTVRYVLWKVDDLVQMASSDNVNQSPVSHHWIARIPNRNKKWGPTSAACWSMSGLHLMMLGQLPYKSVFFPSSEAFRASVKMHFVRGFMVGFIGLAVLDPKKRGNNRSRVWQGGKMHNSAKYLFGYSCVFVKENGSINQHLEKGQVICIYFLFDGSFKFKLDVLVIFTSHQ